MSTLGAYWRLLHPLPSLLTVAAAAAFVMIAARGIPPAGRLVLLLAIQACMQFSISAVNDYFDRAVDAGRPDKPVASGELSARVALGVGAAFGATALVLAVPLGPWVLLLTAVGLGGGLLYDAGAKYTPFSWLPFALAFPTVPLWAWAGAHPDGAIPARLFWVWPVGSVLVLGIHLADTIPDLLHDSAAGVRGLAHRLGLHRSLLLCWGAFAAALLLTLALWIFLPYQAEWFLPGLAGGAALMLAGVVAYRADATHARVMSLLLEAGGTVLAVGWVAGLML